jgi:hypothetical protein
MATAIAAIQRRDPEIRKPDVALVAAVVNIARDARNDRTAAEAA